MEIENSGTQLNAIVKQQSKIRRLTPTECARLQTVPDIYFFDENGKQIVSDTQIYRMLGNGWTIDAIVHLISFAGIKPL